MRTHVFKRPKDDIHITRLATGKAVVRLYTAYIESPLRYGTIAATANVVETTVPDRPDLEAHVLRHWKIYYDKALREEVVYLSNQYEKVVSEILEKLSPGRKRDLTEKADLMIRQIANGDKPFVTKQDFAKILKSKM